MRITYYLVNYFLRIKFMSIVITLALFQKQFPAIFKMSHIKIRNKTRDITNGKTTIYRILTLFS